MYIIAIGPEKVDKHVECLTYIMCYSVYNNIHEMWNSYRPEKVDKQVECLT